MFRLSGSSDGANFEVKLRADGTIDLLYGTGMDEPPVGAERHRRH